MHSVVRQAVRPTFQLGTFRGPIIPLRTYTDCMRVDHRRYQLRAMVEDALIILVPALIILVIWFFGDPVWLGVK